MPARLLMIALDGADSRRLERWSEDGTLPNLAALRRKGRTRRLVGPLVTTDDSLWASFQYGLGEGAHGRLFYHALESSGDLGWTFLAEGGRETFWDRLGARGTRIAIFDVPKCAEIKPVNGIHLADWLVHGRYYNEPRSAPEGLAAEVIARFGPAPPSICGYYQPALSDEQLHEIGVNIRASVVQKRAAALHYLAAEPWDLFIVGFKEAHCAGHGLWNLADPDHPEFDAARSERLGWPVRRIFMDLDVAIGDLVAAAGPAADIVVFSTTEMEPNGSIDHLLPQLVRRLNRAASGQPATWVGRTFDRLDAALSGRAAVFLERALRRLDATVAGHPVRRIEHVFARVDGGVGGWPARWLRQAFRATYGVEPRASPLVILPFTDNAGALRVTDAGPADPASRARLVQQVDALLRELTDAETGLPVVTSIHCPSVECHGARAASLPDILFHYRSKLIPCEIRSPRLGRMRATTRRRRPGNHVMGGLAVAAGPRAAAAAERLTSLDDFEAFAMTVLEGPEQAGTLARPVAATEDP